MHGAITTAVEQQDDAMALERQRIAAEIHDLIMQDLAFALASARGLAADPAHALHASAVVAAGERALTGARDIVGGLLGRDRTPVVEAVRESAHTAARHVPLSFDAGGVPAADQPDQATLDTLVHVAREAVTNAVKHASPGAIEVVLEHADEWRLRVRDDGCGFDASAVAGGVGVAGVAGVQGVGGAQGAGPRGASLQDLGGTEGGFGLQSMRRHAQALGGSLLVRSTPAGGTTVEVVLP